MKHIIIFTLITIISAISTDTFACSPAPDCNIDSIEGEIPCVEAYSYYECFVVLKWTCGEAPGEVIIASDDNTRLMVSAAAPENGVRVGVEGRPTVSKTSQTRINWLSGEQSGGLVVKYTEVNPKDSGCPQDEPLFGDSSCAATPTQQPAAPLTALLPLILGALVWRRRSRR